jgi:hypothetical protein
MSNRVVINSPLMSLEVMQSYQANPHVVVQYVAKAAGDGFALLAVIGGDEHALERQRGGVRIFKTLNAVAGFLSRSLGVPRFKVEADGWNPKQKEIAA